LHALSIVRVKYELPDTLRMVGIDCGQRIKLRVIDLDSKSNEYHTGV